MSPGSTKRRRVTFFLPSFAGGGAEKVMVFLANAMAARGLDVAIAVGSAKGPRRGEVSTQVDVVDLKARRAAFAIIPLARHLRSYQPDAVLSALTHANVAAVAACRLAGYTGRVVVSERNSLSHLRAGHGVKRWARSRLATWAYRSSDCVVSVSRQLGKELAGFVAPKPQEVRTICNPVDVQSIRALAEKPCDITLTGQAANRVVAVGRLTPQKGFDVLLDAMAHLDNKSAHLIILGDGPEREALEAHARQAGIDSRVSFAGFVPNVYAVMARSAVFVLSSRYEGMPNALLEAIACGCRVVSTDCPTGPSEIIRTPDEGILVPVEDAFALAEAIDKVLARPQEAPRATSLDRFSPDIIVDEYIDALFPASKSDQDGVG